MAKKPLPPRGGSGSVDAPHRPEAAGGSFTQSRVGVGAGSTTTAPHPSPPTPLPQGKRGEATLAPITLAAVIGAHGVAGEVRLKVFADDLSAFTRFNGGSLTLKSLRPGNNGAIARFAEITNRNAADALRGTELTVPRDALPPLGEGEYYHADLIGLPVETPDGMAVGRVVLIENFGAGDVIEIEKADGKRFMVPMRPEAVPEWDAVRLVVAADYAEQA